MECKNCGYKQGYMWVEKEDGTEKYEEVNPLNDKFKRIEGSFFAENESSYGGSHEVSLYGCPKCNVVILID